MIAPPQMVEVRNKSVIANVQPMRTMSYALHAPGDAMVAKYPHLFAITPGREACRANDMKESKNEILHKLGEVAYSVVIKNIRSGGMSVRSQFGQNYHSIAVAGAGRRQQVKQGAEQQIRRRIKPARPRRRRSD